MSSVSIVGDVNSGGGVATGSLQTKVTIGGALVLVDGSPVSSHGLPPHDVVITANGSIKVTIGGIPVNRNGDADSCGDTRSSATRVTIG